MQAGRPARSAVRREQRRQPRTRRTSEAVAELLASRVSNREKDGAELVRADALGALEEAHEALGPLGRKLGDLRQAQRSIGGVRTARVGRRRARKQHHHLRPRLTSCGRPLTAASLMALKAVGTSLGRSSRRATSCARVTDTHGG